MAKCTFMFHACCWILLDCQVCFSNPVSVLSRTFLTTLLSLQLLIWRRPCGRQNLSENWSNNGKNKEEAEQFKIPKALEAPSKDSQNQFFYNFIYFWPIRSSCDLVPWMLYIHKQSGIFWLLVWKMIKRVWSKNCGLAHARFWHWSRDKIPCKKIEF